MMGPQLEAQRRFAEIAAGSTAGIDLAEAALWIAAEEQPGLDVPLYCERVDGLAERARPGLARSAGARELAEGLTGFLCGEEAFRGNDEDYYDPRNSYLNEVLDRRLGIPITLAILWISVARRLGADAHGVGFPGHFLAMIRGSEVEEPILVDVFAGRVVTETDCRGLLEKMTGGGQLFHAGMLAPVSQREILSRVLRNLKQIHAERGEWDHALRCVDRILLLEPDHPPELRDRGLLYRTLECWSAAEADLRRYLELSPGAEDRSRVEAILAGLAERVARFH